MAVEADALLVLASAAPTFMSDWDADDLNPYVDVSDLVAHVRGGLRNHDEGEVRAQEL
jgi:hypothetical protein